MQYLNFGTADLDLNDSESVKRYYNQGYVMTRLNPGHMEKVRSIRINLKEYFESSENRRIVKKFNHIIESRNLPYKNYSWEIHKLGKDFYDKKFGVGVFSANKIKEIFVNAESNFNKVLVYINPESNSDEGYCISFTDSDNKILHYSYPFYKLDLINSSFGIFMMTSAIAKAKADGFEYIYLGSAHSPESIYKLQFKGIEWHDEINNIWSNDIVELKARIVGKAY